MKGTYLGEFEEIILLTVLSLDDQAYGVQVTDELRKHTGRSIRLNVVHSSLQRLEEKGFLTSSYGGATSERGGRRKRYYRPTSAGLSALKEARDLRNKLWDLAPRLA